MREIKFRGKRLDNGEWEYGDLLQYDDGSVCIGVHSKNYTDDGFNVGQYHHIAPVNEDTVGEYTGLKDRKGIAIYEGDVIRSPLSEDKTRPHRIFYHTGNAAFMGALIDRKELCYLRLDQDWIYKFGNYLKISHGNGLETMYLHCSKLLVSSGSRVSKGQTIARSGATGMVSGAHLHFVVKKNGNYVNPQNYL